MTHPERQSTAALVTLTLLQLVMLSAFNAGTKTPPSVATPLFGIAPFLGASVPAALAAVAFVNQVANWTRPARQTSLIENPAVGLI